MGARNAVQQDDTTRITNFLKTIVTSPEGHFNLATKNVESGDWHEHWYEWPKHQNKIAHDALKLAGNGNGASSNANVYFTAHLFSAPRSIKENVLPTRTLQADLDHADAHAIPIQPTIVVETSPGRHQAYWVLRTDDVIPLDELEKISRRITYAIPECDRSGWPLGHKMRLPYTYNWKYDTPHHITISTFQYRKIDPTAFDLLPEPTAADGGALGRNGTSSDSWLQLPHALHATHKPRELLAKWRPSLPTHVIVDYDIQQPDRSKTLWALMTEAFKAGADRDDVYHLAYNSANNKFATQRSSSTLDLRKDVLRAEVYVAERGGISITELIRDIRVGKGHSVEKARKVSEITLQVMRQLGEFSHASDGTLWYIRRDLGRPISLERGSSWMNAIMSMMFGLNQVEKDQHHVIADLVNYTRNLPATATVAALSYYDSANENTMLLHTGGKDVMYISPHGIEVKPNGFSDVIFNWTTYTESFHPTFTPLPNPNVSADSTQKNVNWCEFILGDSFNNLVGMERRCALALMRVWIIFLLMRHSSSTRPILALLGSPGSGKSTICRLLYRLLYGKSRSVGVVTSPASFNTSVSHDPLVVLDNVDTWVDWLPDALAQSSAASEITQRVLYTNNDLLRIKREALIAITAHNPRFTREDVTDRLLVFSFRRLDTFRNEIAMLERVSANRNALWGAIVQDCQSILATPRPTPSEAPQFRVQDFASIGLWIARGIGPECERDFVEGITTVQGGQRYIVLENEQMLVDIVAKFIQIRTASNKPTEWFSASQLHATFSQISTDPATFNKTFRSPITLNRKLLVMQEALKAIVDIQVKHDTTRGIRLWKLEAK